MRYLFSLKYFSIYDEATKNYEWIPVQRFRLLNLSANNLNLLHGSEISFIVFMFVILNIGKYL
jgi:hypothetical protein